MFLSRFFCIASLSLAVVASNARAHEFWIEPLRYQVNNDSVLFGVFKNGENFEGNTLSFFDRSSAYYAMAAGAEEITLKPRSGDNPALNAPAPAKDSLVVVAHESTPSLVTYSEWDKFLKFAAHKDFKTAAQDHIDAGWSQARFKESYTRHVKALIGVGAAQGADEPMGLKTEFVALTNPYTEDLMSEMSVRLLFDGAPRPDAQVEVFDRAPDGSVTITMNRTDAQGVATVPVTAGHEYLFDAVTLEPHEGASAEEGATVWKTYWAALTFAVPE